MAPSASVTPTDENESWTSIDPPGATRAPQLRMSSLAGAKRWAPSMCSMSMGPDVAEGVVAELADVGDPVAHPARSRLARNTLLSTAASSAKPSISCGPRSLPAGVDGHDLGALRAERAMATIDRPRKLPISTIRPVGDTATPARRRGPPARG